jgi:asparagine synthetase B (glutamine-hydrolysing)
MSDRCYFKGELPPADWEWTETEAGWFYTCDPTPPAGGAAVVFAAPERHEPAIWFEGSALRAQRDRPGRYPFAWLKCKQGVFVSTDVEFLHRIQRSQRWNTRHIAQALSLYDSPDTEDAYLGTYRLRPGERATFTEAGLKNVQRYPNEVSIFSVEDAVAAIETALQNVCEAIPHNPTVMLSGGLDSTTLAALITKAHKAPAAVTMVSRFESQNEEHVVKALCQQLQIPYQTFAIDGFRPFAPPGPWLQFTGYGMGLYPDMVYVIPLLQHLKTQGVKNVVSGFGADQFFSLSPYRVFEEGLAAKDLHTCQTALDSVSKRIVVGNITSRSRLWRRWRSQASWNHLEFWLTKPIHTAAVPTLLGWWYERSMRGLRLLEKHTNLQIFTPYCESEFLNWVEAIDPRIRLIHANDKHLLRRIAERLLPSEIAWAPKKGFFSEFWEDQIRQIPPEALAKRLEPLRPYLAPDALFSNLLARELSNVASEDSACYSLTNAVCVADVLDSFRDDK